MRSSAGSRFLILIAGTILITSFLSIFSPTVMVQEDEYNESLYREPFVVAATYTPGDYPGGLTLSDGDILDASSGGIYNVSGNFTIVSGAVVSIAQGYKIIIYAENILIAGILDGDGAGYWGGFGGGDYFGYDGYCEPYSGRGRGGVDTSDGGGGGAYGNDGESSYGSVGGEGGQEYGQEGFENPIPSVTDINLGAGAGGGSAGDYVVGGDGGSGGGGVYLAAAGEIMANGTIRCDGQSGETDTEFTVSSGSGGGGGGAGGGILLFGDHVVVSGVLSAKGGAFGAGGQGMPDGNDGGVGSGGRIKIAYSTSLNMTGSSVSVIGGRLSFWTGTYFTYNVDYILPSISLNNSLNYSHHRSNTAIVVNASDSQDLQQVKYNWDGASNTTIQLDNSSYLIATSLPTIEGEHVLDVYAQDVPGNWNHNTFTFISDDTSPCITLESPQNNTIHHSGSIIKIGVTDTFSVSQVLYNWDGFGDNESLSEPYEVVLPSNDVLHNLTLYASDLADNWEYKSYSFVTDDTPPIITSPNDITYTVGTTSHNITWTFTDLHPQSYIVTRNNTPIESGMWTSGMAVTIDIDGHTPGVLIYTIIVFDEVNNLHTDTVVVTVLEIPPITTIPATTTTTPVTTTTSTSPTTSTTSILSTTTIITTTEQTSTSTITTITTTTEPTSSSTTEPTTTPTSTAQPPGIDPMVIVIVGVGALGAVIVIIIVIVNRRS